MNKEIVKLIEVRLEKGKREYEEELNPFDGRDWIVEALEEVADNRNCVKPEIGSEVKQGSKFCSERCDFMECDYECVDKNLNLELNHQKNKIEIFEKHKELIEYLNVEFTDNMQFTHVKMVQLFLNTETEKDFKIWCTELQKQLKTDNLTDTVYEVIKNAYNNSKT